MADTLSQTFEERLQEIETYLDLLEALERQMQTGPPIIGGAKITTQQQKILYSSVYLQLYNLVEATVTWCIDAVCAAATDNGRWRPSDLSEHLRREWVRSTARTHIADLTIEHRLQSAVHLCNHLIQALPISIWEIERGQGGNWDDKAIQAITERLGCQLQISPEVLEGIKRPIRDDKGPLVLVKDLRNRLAHGNLSFVECGNNVTVGDLKEIKDRTVLYLREVITAFSSYIDTYGFLHPNQRPAGGS
jgi:hypothetical protein